MSHRLTPAEVAERLGISVDEVLDLLDSVRPSKRYTPAEAADWLGISVKTVYELLDPEEPEIGFYQVGRSKLIPEEELIAYDKRTFVQAKQKTRHLQAV